MLQKYTIHNDVEQNELRINEYAVLDKELRNANALVFKQHDYSLVGRERYDQEAVLKTIPKGREAVVELLRTENLFPIEPYAREIAETVMALLRSPQDDPVELIFNDVDLFPSPQDEETIAG